MLYFVLAVALCVWGGGGGVGMVGGGGQLEYCEENRDFTLESNQSYIIHLKKVSIQINLKIPCTSCSARQPSMMRVSIACFTALLVMLLLAKGRVNVFSVWPFSL